MRRRFYHPLWTHQPAMLVLILLFVEIIRAIPLPVRAPIHFNLSGNPDSYGDPGIVLLSIIFLGTVYVITGIIIDELWARQEDRKRFNWMSLFDEITVGVLGAFALYYLHLIQEPRPVFRFPWKLALLVTGSATALAVILELARPWYPKPEQITHEDTTAIGTEIGRRIESGRRWAYWETQNPPWNTLLIIVTSTLLLVGAAVSWGQSPWWATTILLVSAAAVMLAYGGIRVTVNDDRLIVKLGVIGIPLLNLRADDIAEAQVHSFSPLRDFGGYGIRINREMKAYFLRGNRGAKVKTVEGKQYLVGSDHPERLVAVIKMVSSVG